MTLNAKSLLCRQSCACCDQMADAIESRGFRYKVTYLSNLYIKFYYEIKGNPFEFQA